MSAAKRAGFTAAGVQRWQCTQCGRTYVWQRPDRRALRGTRWFHAWVREAYSVRQISHLAKVSPSTVRRWIAIGLATPPPWPTTYVDVTTVQFDGTYFAQEGCLLVMLDAVHQQVVGCRYVDRERYSHCIDFFEALAARGLHPRGLTMDGHRQVLRAVRTVWPQCHVQRCLYHIQREGLRWLRTHPKTEAGRALRRLLQCLTAIRTPDARWDWVQRYQHWQQHYGEMVRALPPTSVAAKDLKRTQALIDHALPNLFGYLTLPTLDATTNKLEGFFSRLKADYRRHRGLSLIHRVAYLEWYCYLKSYGQ